MTPEDSSAARRDDGGPPRSTIVLRCTSCGTKNRVDLRRAAEASPRCARCHLPLELPTPQRAPLVVTEATFGEVVERSPLPVLLEFMSQYCMYCQRMRPVLDRLAQTSTDRLRVATVDIDTERGVAARYGVRATPTLLLLDRGRELERIEGVAGEDQLRYRLHRYLTA